MLQHQTKVNTIWFNINNVELDLGAERMFREGIKKVCAKAKKTVNKLWSKMDDLIVDAVRSGDLMEVMNQKAMLLTMKKHRSSLVVWMQLLIRR